MRTGDKRLISQARWFRSFGIVGISFSEKLNFPRRWVIAPRTIKIVSCVAPIGSIRLGAQIVREPTLCLTSVTYLQHEEIQPTTAWIAKLPKIKDIGPGHSLAWGLWYRMHQQPTKPLLVV